MVNGLLGKRPLPCLLAVSFGIPCPLQPKRATRGQAVPKKVARRIEAENISFGYLLSPLPEKIFCTGCTWPK